MRTSKIHFLNQFLKALLDDEFRTEWNAPGLAKLDEKQEKSNTHLAEKYMLEDIGRGETHIRRNGIVLRRYISTVLQDIENRMNFFNVSSPPLNPFVSFLIRS